MTTTAEQLIAPIVPDTAQTACLDSWSATSDSVIDRFLDVIWIRHGLSSPTLDAYRADLNSLSQWLHAVKHKTLVQASSADLREFLAGLAHRNTQSISGMPSLSCIKRFYRHLLDGNFRDDDPTEKVFVRAPRLVRHDLAVVRRA